MYYTGGEGSVMPGVPFFIEALTSAQNANLQVCRKIRAALFKEKIAPLPFASSVLEVADVLNALHTRALAPAVFVVNTFWAHELLLQVDTFIGTTPVVYLHRHLFSESASKDTGTGASKDSDEALASGKTAVLLRKLIERPSVQWVYGSQTTDEVAACGAIALLRFLRDGSFSALEDYAHFQVYEMQRSRNVGSGVYSLHSINKPLSRTEPPEPVAAPLHLREGNGGGPAASPMVPTPQPCMKHGREAAVER